MPTYRVLILGGYGNFGKRIAASLAVLPGVTLLIAGRDLRKSRQLCQELAGKDAKSMLEAISIDIYSTRFKLELEALSTDLVIHTSGPFQGQNYRVPEACIDVGCHYIDLADDRRFVCDITTLNDQAVAKNLLLVSGASSVPGVSSVVIDRFAKGFSRLDTIDFSIAPGNKAERGEATVRGILSYTGHPFKTYNEGKWVESFGWMSSRKRSFGGVIGDRWVANVDIPDLELFPTRYKVRDTVKFQAGLELPLLHFGMVFMAQLAKIGLIKNWSTFTRPIFNTSEWLKRFGSDIGGMKVDLYGVDKQEKTRHIEWVLYAEEGVGPFIPTLSAIILAKKFVAGTLDVRGAIPCLGLYTQEEFDEEARPLGIYHQSKDNIG